MKIIQIVTHQSPHLDELVAIIALRTHGEVKFPGVSTAKIVTWGATDLAKTSPEMAAMQGILLVGLGGGMFDEHGRSDDRHECAATLVAKHLGFDQDPLWRPLLRDVLEADSNASGNLQWFAEELKNLHRYWSGSINLEEVYRRVEPFIVVRLERQKEYLAAKAAFERCYRERLNGIPLVAIDGLDNVQFQHVARNSGAQVIIQRNSHGLTQIFGNENLGLDELASRIRKTEMEASEIRPGRFLDEKELRQVGTLSIIPHWYYEGGFILNGSESFPDTPPSQIRFDKLVRVVENHLRNLGEKRQGNQQKVERNKVG